MGFAQNLKYLMDHYDLTNYQLAKELSCSPTSITNWLSEVSRPQKRTIATIASKFDITIEELCGNELPHIKGENRLQSIPIKNEKPVGLAANGREEEFVQLFSQLTPDQQELVLAQLKGIVDAKDK